MKKTLNKCELSGNRPRLLLLQYKYRRYKTINSKQCDISMRSQHRSHVGLRIWHSTPSFHWFFSRTASADWLQCMGFTEKERKLVKLCTNQLLLTKCSCMQLCLTSLLLLSFSQLIWIEKCALWLRAQRSGLLWWSADSRCTLDTSGSVFFYRFVCH